MGLGRNLIPGLGGLTRMAVLSILAAGMAGCAGATYSGSSYLSPAPFTASEPASPLPAGTDLMTALNKRPMRPPVLAPNARCPASTTADFVAVAPNYGWGAGPVYMSGQDSWYSGGQVVILMVDARYSGPLLVRGFQLSGEGTATVTLAPLGTAVSPADKERQHGVDVVPAVHTAAGGLYLQAVVPSSFWRAWFGWLTTDSPGCFGLQVDGDVFTEFIVFSVQAGTPPPG